MSTASDALGLLQDPEGSLQPSVPTNANADAVGALLAGVATRTLTADANYTLVAADYRVATLVLTSSALTTGRDIVFPAYFPPMLVVNDTGQTLTLKKSGQTGVTVDDGESIRVNCGPTDVLASTVGGSGGSVTSVNGATGAPIIRQALAIACSDETTALTTGTNKAKFINPYSTAFNVVAVVASLSTAQTSGSIFTVDINEAGTSILSTKLTIDNGETNSSTAATPAVISDASIAAFAEIGIDIDQIGDGTAKGLKVYLIGYPTP